MGTDRIVGIDPGKTTGICSFSILNNDISCASSVQLDLCGVGNYLEQATDHNTVFVVEQYRYNPKKPANYSLEIIGIVRWYAYKNGSGLKFRTPAQAKGLCTNEVLKRAGLYFPGQNHSCDAARLGLHYCLTDLKQLQHVLKEA